MNLYLIKYFTDNILIKLFIKIINIIDDLPPRHILVLYVDTG